MKKIVILLAVASMAITSHALQISWGSDGAVYNGSTVMSPANNYSVTAYLVYLGGAGADWTGFDIQASYALGGDILKSNVANNKGVVPVAGTAYGFDLGNLVGAGTDKMVNGESTFGIIFIATGTGSNSDFGTQYLLSETFVFDTANARPGVGQTGYDGVSTFEFYSQASKQGAIWTKVPEPATAAMALAGLALLFRRKRK